MKTSFFLITILFTFINCASLNSKQYPVKIIFDTDMGPDYDDVGAIAVLHALAAKGECEIIACVASDSHPSVAPTIELFNRYFGLPNIPIGLASKDAPNFIASNNWNDSLIRKFSPNLLNKTNYPSAIKVYRKALSEQPDKSVTIITVGFINNIAGLLKSGPDEFSSLSGIELVKLKVKKWVAMAGGFPEGNEFNLNRHAESASYAFKHWPTPILLSGHEIGNKINTGIPVSLKGKDDNPVAWAYRFNSKTYKPEISNTRESWDQTAVLCAIRAPEKYFYVEGPAKFNVFQDGKNMWSANDIGLHYFLVHKYPYSEIENIIDELMLYEPN